MELDDLEHLGPASLRQLAAVQVLLQVPVPLVQCIPNTAPDGFFKSLRVFPKAPGAGFNVSPYVLQDELLGLISFSELSNGLFCHFTDTNDI